MSEEWKKQLGMDRKAHVVWEYSGQTNEGMKWWWEEIPFYQKFF